MNAHSLCLNQTKLLLCSSKIELWKRWILPEHFNLPQKYFLLKWNFKKLRIWMNEYSFTRAKEKIFKQSY